jgi:HSP20 family molecular chaperone IbpA
MPRLTIPNQDSNNHLNTDLNSSNNNLVSSSQASVTWKPEEVPQLTVDVYRQENIIFVVSTVAGVNPKDLDISIEQNVLSIKGFRRKPYDEQKSNILLEECFWGEFFRELTINEHIDVDSIKATINQGVLVIEVPILQLTPHRKIEVNFNN